MSTIIEAPTEMLPEELPLGIADSASTNNGTVQPDALNAIGEFPQGAYLPPVASGDIIASSTNEQPADLAIEVIGDGPSSTPKSNVQAISPPEVVGGGPPVDGMSTSLGTEQPHAPESDDVVVAERIHDTSPTTESHHRIDRAPEDNGSSEDDANVHMEDLPVSLPPELSDRFNKLQAKIYKNGTHHIYGVDEEGKRTHLRGNDVLQAFGYKPRNEMTAAEIASYDDDPESSDAISETLNRISDLEEKVAGINEKLDTLLAEPRELTEEKPPVELSRILPDGSLDEETKEADRRLTEKQADNDLDDAIKQYANASNYSESILSNKEERTQRLAEATTRLREAQEKVLDFQVKTILSADKQLIYLNEDAVAAIDEAEKTLEELYYKRDLAGVDYDGSLDEQIKKRNMDVANAILCLDLVAEKVQKRVGEIQEFRVSQTLQLAKRIEDEKLRLRVEQHPRLAKINNWIQKHPKARLGVGLGLAAMGVVGTATFNAPLVGLAVAGGSALRAYGSYNFVRGIGDVLANHKMKKADIATVQDLLDITNEQTTTRRKSKRGALAVATVLALTPVVAKFLEASQTASKPGVLSRLPGSRSAPPGSSSTAHPIPSGPPAIDHNILPGPSPANHGLSIIATHGNMLPWTYAEQFLHTNISNPAVLEKLTNNNLGIKFIGNGQSGGLGAINSVVINGQSYSDIGHINGAISAILG